MEHYIPLGTNCTVASYLRRNKMREHALPFDWNWTPIQSAIEMIENGFEDFLKEKNLMFLPQMHQELFNEDDTALIRSRTIVTPTLCTRYNMLFTHDFPKAGVGELPNVKSKYMRRITRLHQLLATKGDHLIFIADDNTLNELPVLENNAHVGHTDWYSIAGRKFVNHYDGWQDKFHEMMSRAYPDVSYELHNFKEWKDNR